MSSVAEKLRADSRERLRRMTPAERLAEAIRLGQSAIAVEAAEPLSLGDLSVPVARPAG